MNSNGISQHISSSQVSTVVAIDQPPRPPALMQIKVSPGNPPWSETVLVTPDLAEFWLQANTFNRKHRKSRVKSYARDMAAGNWLFNTQGIEFATDGSLINGQHRLMAVVESGVSVTMVVWFNVPPKTRSVIDLGSTRNLSDIAQLTTTQAAVVQAMMRGLSSRSNVGTMAERARFYNQYAGHIDAVIGRFPTHIRGVTQANVLAAITRASFHLTAEDIEHFCEVLRSGIPSFDSRDITIIRLRDKLLSRSGASGTLVSKEIYGLTAAALRAFRDHKVLTKLYAISTDPFSLPESVDE